MQDPLSDSDCAVLDVDLGDETDSSCTDCDGYGIRYGGMCGSKFVYAISHCPGGPKSGYGCFGAAGLNIPSNSDAVAG